MKLVVVTVSAPVLQLLPAAVRKLNQTASESIELKLFYAVTEYSAQKQQEMEKRILDADAVLIDLMGAPPANVEAVNRACANARGQIIPYGASPREYLRLGAFTSASMGGMGGGERKAPSPEAMKKMGSMAKVMGKAIPGKMRDMRNYTLLCTYFQNACLENMEGFVNLLAAEYGKVRGLPRIKPPLEPLPAAIYDLESMEAYTSLSAFKKALRQNPELPNVVIHFTAYAYPTDTNPVVREISRKLSAFCNVIPVGTSGFFSEFEKSLEAFLLNPEYPIALYLDCTPFRLGAGPMGGAAEKGVNLLERVGAAYLHPMFLTRRTEQQWRDSVSGCSPNEVLISVMLPEMDGAEEILPVAAMTPMAEDPQSHEEICGLQIIPERLEHLTQRVRRHLLLREKENREKRVAIICYNYPPGEGSLFGGAFLDTFASVSAILGRLKQEGYKTNALSPEQLRDIFTMGKAVNSGRYDTDWEDRILWDAKKSPSSPEITEAWGKAPGNIMTEDGAYFIPGTVQGNVFIGLQPARGNDPEDATSYHDKMLPPHHQYAAFYRWLQQEFQADVLIHVGTHGTLEFLKGKECGMSGDCWPDRLVGDLPHIYLYYCGNPSEAVIARRRSYANLISYQPPVFVKGGLYGDFLSLSTLLDDYQHLLAVSPSSAEGARKLMMEKARALGLPEDPEEIENELYRMNNSLIPKGLHIFGESYQEEELNRYAEGIAALRAGQGEVTEDILRKAREDAKPAGHNREMDGLMAALEDRFNPAKLGGDLFRSPEIMPTGYNLYQFDARQVPSEAAIERGREIAENTLAAFRQDQGKYPGSVAVIAWGLETSRTQGETVGQILAYLGVRPVRNGSIWEHRYELIPLEELGRPRIDVTVNICGFFRDMFPNVVDELDDVFRMAADAEEPENQNYVKAHTRSRYDRLIREGHSPEDAWELATARLFGPREGEYGTGLTSLVELKSWEAEEDLGANFTDSLHYIYTRHSRGRNARELYQENLSTVEVISQLRANTEYEITDLDHYYEFFGGLAKSVEMVRGQKSAMYITDVTGGQIHTETVDKSIARGLRTRVLNPKWIDGLLAHPYHGAQKIAERFENVMGLAATTGAVDSHFYDDLEACYVKDEARKQQMEENNPHAYLNILEQMLEYNSRGYWNASEEQLSRIRAAYLSLEDKIETMQ